MTQRERDSLTEPDPHTLLFGHDDEAEGVGTAEHPSGPHPIAAQPSRRMDRHAHRHKRKVRRNRRVFLALTAFVVAVIVALGYVGYGIYQNRYHPKDYQGPEGGPISIVVHTGDNAAAIGKTLHDKGVVASVRAFTNAASDDSRSQGISPGTYQLRMKMSAKNAVALMLDPASRLSNKVVVPEGATVLDVVAAMAKALGVSQALVRAGIANVRALGLPRGYTSGALPPASVEGFLYPATYSFDPGTSINAALQQMITQFTDQARTSGFTTKAQALKISPYEALIIASMVQSEAKYAADMPKVVRVILNRLAAKTALKIDAATLYGARLKGIDRTKVNIATFDSPYNTYLHDGLPPTPISNPGAEAMTAAVHPVSGNWLYYVNGDANGNLFFTNSEAEFVKAAEKCRTNHWGCG